MRPSPHHDDQLLERLRSRDETAVNELVTTFRPKILSMANRVLRNREDAEEVAQDVFLKVFRSVEGFRGDAAFSSWVYRIAFNTIISRLRSTRAHQLPIATTSTASDREPETAAPHEVLDWTGLADERVMRRQMRRQLALAMQALPPMYRVPVILRDLHGLTTEEASRQLSLKDETLKSRLHRGRTMLRKRLADFAAGVTLHRVA